MSTTTYVLIRKLEKYRYFLVEKSALSRAMYHKYYDHLTLSLPNFRRHLSSAFVLNKLSTGKKFIRKLEKTECQTA